MRLEKVNRVTEKFPLDRKPSWRQSQKCGSKRAMQFSPKEIKIIERLRKQHRNWPLTRWLVLFNGILLSGSCAFFLSFEVHHFREASQMSDDLLHQIGTLSPDQISKHLIELVPLWRDQVLEVAILFPIWLLFVVLAYYHFVILIVNWRGHSQQLLLLKLLDSQLDQSDKDGTSPKL
jgi:hypothetical protein